MLFAGSERVFVFDGDSDFPLSLCGRKRSGYIELKMSRGLLTPLEKQMVTRAHVQRTTSSVTETFDFNLQDFLANIAAEDAQKQTEPLGHLSGNCGRTDSCCPASLH